MFFCSLIFPYAKVMIARGNQQFSARKRKAICRRGLAMSQRVFLLLHSPFVRLDVFNAVMAYVARDFLKYNSPVSEGTCMETLRGAEFPQRGRRRRSRRRRRRRRNVCWYEGWIVQRLWWCKVCQNQRIAKCLAQTTIFCRPPVLPVLPRFGSDIKWLLFPHPRTPPQFLTLTCFSKWWCIFKGKACPV